MMKKLLKSLVAVLLMVMTVSTVQAATSLEQQLIDLKVPADEAKIISEFVRTNEISDATVDKAVKNASLILEVKGDASMQELSAEAKAQIQLLLNETADSVGLTFKLDGEKIAVFESNGEQLLNLSTVILEEVVSTNTAEDWNTKLPKLGEQGKAEAGQELPDKDGDSSDNNGSDNNGTNNNGTNNNGTNNNTPTTPTTLNKTGVNGMAMMVTGLVVITLGAGLFVVSRKINA